MTKFYEIRRADDISRSTNYAETSDLKKLIHGAETFAENSVNQPLFEKTQDAGTANVKFQSLDPDMRLFLQVSDPADHKCFNRGNISIGLCAVRHAHEKQSTSDVRNESVHNF